MDISSMNSTDSTSFVTLGGVDLNFFRPYVRQVQMPEKNRVIHHALPYAMEVMKESFWRSYFMNPCLRWGDIRFFVAGIITLSFLRIILSGVIREPWDSYFSIFKYLGKKYGICRPGKASKFAENLWYFIWHTLSTVCNIWILSHEIGTYEDPRWLQFHLTQPDGRWYWAPTKWEHENGNPGWPALIPSERIRYFYLTQVSFWSTCALFLSVESRRSDFFAMIIHHVATLMLTIFSYTMCYWRIGLVVLFLHDIVDILLYFGKTLQFSHPPQWIIDIVFTAFIITYLIARLLLFPIYCVWPTLNRSVLQEITNNMITSSWDVPGGLILPFCLTALMGLHAYWYHLIIIMVRRVLRQKAAGEKNFDDIRSDDEKDIVCMKRSIGEKEKAEETKKKKKS